MILWTLAGVGLLLSLLVAVLFGYIVAERAGLLRQHQLHRRDIAGRPFGDDLPVRWIGDHVTIDRDVRSSARAAPQDAQGDQQSDRWFIRIPAHRMGALEVVLDEHGLRLDRQPFQHLNGTSPDAPLPSDERQPPACPAGAVLDPPQYTRRGALGRIHHPSAAKTSSVAGEEVAQTACRVTPENRRA